MRIISFIATCLMALILVGCGGGGGAPGLSSSGPTSVFVTSAPESLSLDAGTSVAFVVSGGTLPYAISSTDSRVVTGVISSSTVAINALAEGVATVKILDALGVEFLVVVTVDASSTGPGGPASVDILPSSNTIASASGSKVTFIVTVKDGKNSAMANQSVNFVASSGTLSGSNPTPKTDASGNVTTVSLSPGADATVRNITVTATSGSVSKSVSIPVTGTTLTISGPGSALVSGKPLSYGVKALDSAGKPLKGLALTLSSTLGNTVSPPTATTDVSGVATFDVIPSVVGTDTIRATGLGTSATTTVSVSNEDFAFTAPLVQTSLMVNAINVVTVQYKVAGVGVPGKTVSFNTTRGYMSTSPSTVTTAVTDASGSASTTVVSSTAGPVTFSAQLGTARTSLTTAFIASVPASVALQSNPSAVLPNTVGSTNNQSALTAIVRDATGNPVSNQTVVFTSLKDGSNGSIVPGSASTDANGVATVQFIPGALSTPANGVEVLAVIQSNPNITSNKSGTTPTYLTVNGNALFISIGQSNVLTVLDSVSYEKDFSVYVTDANAVPVANRSVQISAFPTNYKKGYLKFQCETPSESCVADWNVRDITITSCPNEDVNKNGILDSGEDTNKNGSLEPGIPVVITPSSLTTDANGFANFKMRYAKNFALWVETEITARALVGGTESSKTSAYALGMTLQDAISQATPANAVSPFGVATACSDKN